VNELGKYFCIIGSIAVEFGCLETIEAKNTFHADLISLEK